MVTCHRSFHPLAPSFLVSFLPMVFLGHRSQFPRRGSPSSKTFGSSLFCMGNSIALLSADTDYMGRVGTVKFFCEITISSSFTTECAENSEASENPSVD